MPEDPPTLSYEHSSPVPRRTPLTTAGATVAGALIGLIVGLTAFCWAFGALLQKLYQGDDPAVRLVLAALVLVGGGSLAGGVVGFRWSRPGKALGLQTVELFMDMEDYFHVQIPDAAFNLITGADVQAVIVELLEAQGKQSGEELRREVWDGMMAVVAKRGYLAEQIQPKSKWVGDITRHG